MHRGQLVLRTDGSNQRPLISASRHLGTAVGYIQVLTVDVALDLCPRFLTGPQPGSLTAD